MIDECETFLLNTVTKVEDAINYLSSASAEFRNPNDEEVIIFYRDRLNDWLDSYQTFVVCHIDKVIEERLIKYTTQNDMILKDIDINIPGN